MVAACLALMVLSAHSPQGEPQTLTFRGAPGPAQGKRIVLLAGDEEYRSEEGLPQLAKILSKRHGFTCTVVFSLNHRGEIDPTEHFNQPGIEALKDADLCILLLRFREWPDAQMKPFVDYYRSGKPFLALRTSTHAFDYKRDSASAYRSYGWSSAEWPGGFGKQVLGENWVSHWGNHGSQATRGVVEPGKSVHPILRGVEGIFGTTDVYEAAPPPGAEILLRGEVVQGMSPSDPPATGQKATAKGVRQGINDPMMPIAWLLQHKNETGCTNQVLTCTMGAATDLLNEGLRRFLVNGCYWLTGLQGRIPAKANVDLVGDYRPSAFGFGGFKKGLKPGEIGGWGVEGLRH